MSPLDIFPKNGTRVVSFCAGCRVRHRHAPAGSGALGESQHVRCVSKHKAELLNRQLQEQLRSRRHQRRILNPV